MISSAVHSGQTLSLVVQVDYRQVRDLSDAELTQMFGPHIAIQVKRWMRIMKGGT